MSVTLDPSSRFVLPDDAPYLRNLAALWSTDPALASQIELLPDEEMYPIEFAKDGNPTLAIPAGDGKRIYLHSRHRPVDEANKLTDAIDFDQKFIFFVHGLGLAYAVDRLLEKSSTESTIVVFEPDPKLLKTTLWHRDLSKALDTKRLVIVTGGDKSSFFNRVAANMALVTASAETLSHAPSVQLHPDFHAETARWCDEFASYARTSINTLIINGRRTAENIARNVAWYAAAPGVGHLKDRYKRKPAVIVSAGPSLRKNKHLLKGLEDSACIIAVQTTLQPLLEMGVEPHFVTSLDYHEISARFFEKLPKNLKTELVAEPKANKVVLGLHTGPVSLLGNDYAERLLKELKINKPTLRAGATVAHLAFYLAEHLGCDPVILVGQDLGFSDGLCYAPGTSYEDVWRPELSRFCTVEMKQWEQIVRERHILRRVEDIDGRPTYTEERLYAYLQQFERDFLQSTTQIIDATEGGVRKRGTTVLPLADAIAQHCTAPLRHSERSEESKPLVPNPSRLEECRAALIARKEEASKIEEITTQTLPLLEEVRDSLHDQQKVNHLIARIDELRGRMNDLGECYELILQLTQTTELQRFHHDRAIAASRVKGSDKQRRQVLRDIENVNAIRAAAGEFRTLMDRVLAELA